VINYVPQKLVFDEKIIFFKEIAKMPNPAPILGRI